MCAPAPKACATMSMMQREEIKIRAGTEAYVLWHQPTRPGELQELDDDVHSFILCLCQVRVRETIYTKLQLVSQAQPQGRSFLPLS
jgi:hypothetical protein